MNQNEIIAQHNERENEVVEFLMNVMGEVNQIFLNEPNGYNKISLRIQMIIAFSAIDVMAHYWFAFLNKTGKTNERAQMWYEEFCAKDENKYWVGLYRDVTSKRLYDFRNALVHFFGMGEVIGDEIYIALVASDLTAENKEKMEHIFLEKGHKTIMIYPKDFFDLVREGARIMIRHWLKMIAEAQTDKEKEKEYIDGIERVWSKTRKEGAKYVPPAK
jgi:hypothetical protein